MATIDLTLSDDEAQRPPAPAPAAPPPRRRKRDVLDSSSSDGEAPAPAPACRRDAKTRRPRQQRRRRGRARAAPAPDDEAAATARAAANLKRALAKPQDLTLSSDDEQQQPKKKPKTAEPAEPENVVSRKTVEAAIAAASKWRGAHTRISGGDDVDEDEDVAKARRLMRTTQSYEDVEFPASIRSLKGNENEQPPPPSDPSQPPSCSCGHRAGKSTVKKEDSENKGRPYWHCANRRCGLFQWADRPPPKP